MNVVLALKELGIPKTKYQVDGSCKLPDFFLRSYEDAPGRGRVAPSEPICQRLMSVVQKAGLEITIPSRKTLARRVSGTVSKMFSGGVSRAGASNVIVAAGP